MDFYFTVMQFHQLFGERQAQACAFGLVDMLHDKFTRIAAAHGKFRLFAHAAFFGAFGGPVPV